MIKSFNEQSCTLTKKRYCSNDKFKLIKCKTLTDSFGITKFDAKKS